MRNISLYTPRNKKGLREGQILTTKTSSNNGMYQPSIIGTSIENIQHAFHSERNQQIYQDIKARVSGIDLQPLASLEYDVSILGTCKFGYPPFY